MWCFRKILNVFQLDKVLNFEFLRRIGKEAEVINNIKSRKLQYFRRMQEILAFTAHTTKENILEIRAEYNLEQASRKI